MRLDKYLSDMGLASRAELKKEIRGGLITVDGAVVRDPGFHVSEETEILRKGVPVRYEAFVYYMLNKPAGVISATEDKRQRTVLDLLPAEHRKGIAPVGRLDKDTVGLLLLTNDGELAHRLLSPRHHVDKVYFARVCGAVTDADVQAFAEGLRISDDLLCLPAKLEILSVSEKSSSFPETKPAPTSAPAETPSDAIKDAVSGGTAYSEIRVTIQEGKYHQIKRMFEAVGKEIVFLKRLSMGPLVLDPELPEGACRRLTDAELSALRSLC